MTRKKLWLWMIWSPLLVIIAWFLVSLVFYVIELSWTQNPLISLIKWSINWFLWVLIMVSIILFIIWICIYLSSRKSTSNIAEESIKEGRTHMKNTVWKWVPLLLVSWVVIIGLALAIETYFPIVEWVKPTTKILVWAISWNLLYYIITSVIAVWLASISLDIIRGSWWFPWYGSMFSRTWVVFPWILTSILFTLIKIVGLILFIIPWIYWGLRFKFWDLFIIDKWYWPIEALKASWRITEDHRWEVLVLEMYQWMIQIPWALALLVWLFATIPTALIADVSAYEKFLKLYEEKIIAEVPNNPKKTD